MRNVGEGADEVLDRLSIPDLDRERDCEVAKRAHDLMRSMLTGEA
jgi:hypothetical protein